jgi:hypothetical protein
MAGKSMTISALSRRLRAVEAKAPKRSRPTTAFVIRAKTREDAQATLARALSSNLVAKGDPVIILTCMNFESAEWDDIGNLNLVDLARLAEGDGDVRCDGARIDPTKLTDEELHAAIVDGLPRVG